MAFIPIFQTFYTKISALFLKIGLLLGGLAVLATLYLYPRLPEIIPTHMSALGNFDGFDHKQTIFLLPILLVISGCIMSLAKMDRYFPKYSFINVVSKCIWFLLNLVIWFGVLYFYIAYFKIAR
ncbi:DUF1648 domain-containing protein [Enterococcus sp. CSURQ0835]|uniref:DUF1648 domain-containing protein n=1 Tax=Enterococcus sp. CSURQ0835 TaxID=2681394 RepID=UPI00135C6253|nr:DUF1648 domain-containing protein [Enterococcus sp. CSURQ0835]